MIRKDLNDITEESYLDIVIPFNKQIANFIVDSFLNEFVAFYFYKGYNESAIWNEPVDDIINTACESFVNISKDDCDLKLIKEILKEKYKLEIINDEHLEIIEVS